MGKVNVHENFDLASEFSISRIPVVMLFRGGKKPVKQYLGLVAEAQLVRALNDVLNG